MNKEVCITLAKPFAHLFEPHRYKVYYGGRGGAKSWGFAIALVMRAANRPTRILCAREFQASITESVHKLLVDTISRLNLEKFFSITDKSITGINGSEFFFHGLYHDINKVKSIENIDICWIEEAHSVSKKSWDVLIPTIRSEDSEIWISFNPFLETDETYQRFILEKINGIKVKVGWRDNPWFPKVLDDERKTLKERDFDAYLNIWEGEPLRYSNAQVFKNKYEVLDFETPLDTYFYYGVDWGFAVDPTAITRSFIDDDCLYIDYEAYREGVELDDMEDFFNLVPLIRDNAIKADNARPETIRYMYRRGFDIKGAKKWGGSVMDGIAYLKGFKKIYIHPRCVHTIQEFKAYNYKVEKRTERILPELEDRWNHCIDSLRYALDGQIKSRGEMNF